MMIEPEQRVISSLEKLCDELNIDSMDLDDVVHDAVSGWASDANNGGMPDQLKLLIMLWGHEGTVNYLENFADELSASRRG